LKAKQLTKDPKAIIAEDLIYSNFYYAHLMIKL